jgi:hypothetical protein
MLQVEMLPFGVQQFTGVIALKQLCPRRRIDVTAGDLPLPRQLVSAPPKNHHAIASSHRGGCGVAPCLL